jgi:hypothetical protein
VLLPGDARPGDVVAVFQGATFPYVLRKLAGEEYLLVGEAFLPQRVTEGAISQAEKTTKDMIRIV